ncbi:MAG TPA: arsenic resistance N-acetyltransferase ArsN2 [Vicinamibacteria bacterium]
MPFRTEHAQAHDLASARELLHRVNLPDHGVAEQFGHYLVVRDASRLVGLCGVEVCGDDGLLRRVAVDPDYRGEGIGGLLVGAAQELAGKLRLDALYLLTTTADAYFRRLGFQEVAREKAPEGVRNSWEFRAGCPASSTLMRWGAGPQAGRG